MQKSYIIKSALTGLFILAASACANMSTNVISADPSQETALETPFETGANSLFAGHSFFIPVASSFNKIGRQMGFEDHRVQVVFAGGRKGTPGSLWSSKSKRQQIETALQTGKIDLFGLVAGGGGGSDTEDFAKWVGLALQYNPDTEFLIARSWITGGPRTKTSKFDQEIAVKSSELYTVVTGLRSQFPGVQFHFINYGKAAPVMKREFEAERLDDIQEMSGKNNAALFRDRRQGHGGQMMLDVSALYWVHRLYGVELADLPSLGYAEEDVSGILIEVENVNPRFD